jgi:hypothetical protein
VAAPCSVQGRRSPFLATLLRVREIGCIVIAMGGNMEPNRASSTSTSDHGGSAEQSPQRLCNVDEKRGREVEDRVGERARDAPASLIGPRHSEEGGEEGGSDGDSGA